MLAHLPHPELRPRGESLLIEPGNDIVPPTSATKTSSSIRSVSPIAHKVQDFPSLSPSTRNKSPTRGSTFLPNFLIPPRGRSLSPERLRPTRPADPNSFIDSQTSPSVATATSSGKLAGWFNGASEPVNFRLIPSPAKERSDPFLDSDEMDRGFGGNFAPRDHDTFTKRPTSQFHKSQCSLSMPSKDTSSSRFAFWRSKSTSLPDKHQNLDDDIANLDIQSALFPQGQTAESPHAALKALQANAEETIRMLKNAYVQNLQSLRDANAEKAALKDEAEAMQTRSEHTKSQLANMADKLSSQEADMLILADELATIRRQHAEFRHRSLRIVTPESTPPKVAGRARLRSDTTLDWEAGRRSSNSLSSPDRAGDSLMWSPSSQSATSTCTPISSPENDSQGSKHDTYNNSEHQCRNCHNVRQSEAWDVVRTLSEENHTLKTRLAECENANEDALSLLKLVGSSH